MDIARGKIAEGDKDSLNSAYWSMQMSCELAMKSLMQQNLGKIIKKLNLYNRAQYILTAEQYIFL